MNKNKFNPFHINFDELGKTVDDFISNVQLDDFLGNDCLKLENQINAKIANKLQCKIIAEAANGPTLPEADPIIYKKKILVLIYRIMN